MGRGDRPKGVRLQTKDKIRVYALAKNLDVESKIILDHCRDLEYDVKNQLSVLEPEQAEIVKQRILKGTKPSGPEPQKTSGANLPPKDRKIVNIQSAKTPQKSSVPVQEIEPPRMEEEPIPFVEEPPPPSPAPIPTPTISTPPTPKVVSTPIRSLSTPNKIPSSTGTPSPKTTQPSAYMDDNRPIGAEASPTNVTKVSNLSETITNPVPTATVDIKPNTEGSSPISTASPTIQETVSTPVPEEKVSTAPPTPEPIIESKPTTFPTPLPKVGGPSIRNLNAPRPQQSSDRPRQTGSSTTPTDRSRQTGSGSSTTPTPKPTGTPSSPTNKPNVPQPTPKPTQTTPVNQGKPAGTGNPPGGGGGSGGRQIPPIGERHRRHDRDRKPGDIARDKGGSHPPKPGQTAQPPKDEKKPPQGNRQPPQSVPQNPEEPAEGELDADGKKRPGNVVGRDNRHKERAKRQEKRKEKASVVIKDGHVELVEEEFGRKLGRRPKPKIKAPITQERKGKIPVTLPISVRSLSAAIGMKVAELIYKLKDLTNSLFTINSPLEVEVAELIAEEKGAQLEILRPKDLEEDVTKEHDESSDDPTKLEPRAPIVTIMGHVDHGKTSLLDKIREQYGIKSDVVSTEAGGITQVIRAWRVEKDGKPVTFLDTPGHEAFTKMRARGANVTDIAVIVVAADDGVMPQTEEAISHAKAAGVPIVVAINKIDLPNANLKKTEQQLYSLNLLPDNMGGEDCYFVYTSAATGKGIDQLLETLSLVAEIKELKANPHKLGRGVCLEAYMSGDEGVMATLLVQQGTLHKGDIIICGATYGRVRAMYDDLGRPIKQAGPSVPVRITGLDDVPNADDHFHAVTELSKAAEIAEKRRQKHRESQYAGRIAVKMEDIGKPDKQIAELKIILKAEAKGSIEAIRKELEKLVHEEVRVRVLHAGIGAITESDVHLALASPEDSMIVGFNVVPDDNALKFAEERKIPIREYNIIYNLTNDIKAALEGKLKPREEITQLGRAIVRQTFKISKVGTVAGCYVTQGVIERSSKVRIIREGVVIFPPPERTVGLEALKRFKDDVREVREGFECGIKLAGFDDIKVGDVIEAYRVEQVQRTL
jgi:translation initiation factor IF-2